MTNEELLDDNNYYSDEEIIWEDEPHIPRAELISIVGNHALWPIIALVFIYEFAALYNNLIVELFIIIPFEFLIIYLAFNFIIKEIERYRVRYCLTSHMFTIIYDKQIQNYQKRDLLNSIQEQQRIEIKLDKIEYITVIRTRFGIQCKFTLASNNNENYLREYKTVVINKYLELISALFSIIDFDVKVKKNMNKVVILQR